VSHFEDTQKKVLFFKKTIDICKKWFILHNEIETKEKRRARKSIDKMITMLGTFINLWRSQAT